MKEKADHRKPGVLLAFSGGIDSSHCVGKLRAQGYHVEGVVFDMTGDAAFIRDALQRAGSLGLPCQVADVSRDFREKIIDYFTGEYLNGRTPAPCTRCNPLIKWHYLYELARENGFDRIATGHYFRIAENNGHYHVRKAVDNVKDQSYYLWMLPQEILAMALTPMGDEIKKALMEPAGSGQPRESMGVCFLKNSDYREFIREADPAHPCCQPGTITDGDGKALGNHEGAAFYTTGQKKGLGLPGGYAVTGIDAPNNRLIAGKKDELLARTLVLEEYLIAPGYAVNGGYTGLQAVIRGYGHNPEGNCTVTEDGDTLMVYLENPAMAPAKGQPAVIYDGELVAGGGFIRDYF